MIAIPGANSELLRELCDVATAADLQILVLPPITELFGGAIGVGDIRPLTDADLLGRHVIDTDVAAIAGYLTGRRVLVTGAGGSIGSELCRQLARFAPAELVMLDRDESALHGAAAAPRGPGHARRPQPGRGRHPRRRPDASRSSPSTGPRSSSTPPPSSTSRCSRCTRARP